MTYFHHDRVDALARQYLGSIGEMDNGILAEISLWAGERCSCGDAPSSVTPMH